MGNEIYWIYTLALLRQKELKNGVPIREVKATRSGRCFIFSIDGLKGFSEAIWAVYSFFSAIIAAIRLFFSFLE